MPEHSSAQVSLDGRRAVVLTWQDMTTSSSAPPRPDNVPETAIWDPEDKAFRAGEVDSQGAKQGLWTAWYPSGRVYGEDRFEAGVAHGESWCARGEGDETPFDATFDARVARLERTHDRGMLMRDRCYTATGELVGSDGEPWPARAAHIPESANYLARSEMWVDGPIDAAAPITGRQRLWYREGPLLADTEFRDGAKHGISRVYRHAGLSVATELVGPPRTHLIEATYDNGALRRVVFYAKQIGGSDLEPAPLASIDLVEDQPHGTVTWDMDRHQSFDKPVLAIGSVTIRPADMRGDKPVRGASRFEVDFERGVPKARRAYAKDGALIVPPADVAEFGQETAPDQLAGYIVRGDLARDLEAFFPGEEPSAFDRDASRASEVFAALPAPHRAAALAFDALVKAGKVPYLQAASLNAYGFDAVKNDLYGAAEARYFGLAYDDMGNMQLLDLETGAVKGYEHEEGIFDKRRTFPDLDTWAFAMLRIELAAQRRTPKDAIEALFTRLGLDAAVVELRAATH